jgi:hypothetical protein
MAIVALTSGPQDYKQCSSPSSTSRGSASAEPTVDQKYLEENLSVLNMYRLYPLKYSA